jgi:ATP-dependent Clp protease ATP-binding subunit ClpA
MLNRKLETNLNNAFQMARQKRFEFMTVEHLLLALLNDKAALDVLQACGTNLNELKKELLTFLEKTTPKLSKKDKRDTQPTLGFQRVLQRALFNVQSTGKKEVTGANVLVAILSERESQAVFFLEKQDISRLDSTTNLRNKRIF